MVTFGQMLAVCLTCVVFGDNMLEAAIHQELEYGKAKLTYDVAENSGGVSVWFKVETEYQVEYVQQSFVVDPEDTSSWAFDFAVNGRVGEYGVVDSYRSVTDLEVAGLLFGQSVETFPNIYTGKNQVTAHLELAPIVSSSGWFGYTEMLDDEDPYNVHYSAHFQLKGMFPDASYGTHFATPEPTSLWLIAIVFVCARRKCA